MKKMKMKMRDNSGAKTAKEMQASMDKKMAKRKSSKPSKTRAQVKKEFIKSARKTKTTKKGY